MSTGLREWRAHRRILCKATLFLVVVVGSPPCIAETAEPSILENATFREWKDGRPAGWEINTGAITGQGRTTEEFSSKIERRAKGTGLRITGLDSTEHWLHLRQVRKAVPGQGYQLILPTRVQRGPRNAKQFDNSHVSITFRDAQGQELLRKVRTLIGEKRSLTYVTTTAPPGAATLEVALFFSVTGVLEVDGIALQPFDAEDAPERLSREIDRHYSHFARSGCDWKSVSREGIASVREAEGSPEAYATWLGKLRDPHVWVRDPAGKIHPTHVDDPVPNFDRRTMRNEVNDIEFFRGLGYVGRTRQGFGVIGCVGLQQNDAFAGFRKAVERLLDAPGLIIDLRANGGGNERVGQWLASHFCKEPVVYARSRIRSGAGHDEFTEVAPRLLQPHPSLSYDRPVVVITGPVCMSSGEGLVMMLDALPSVQLMGQPTRGASGNPATVELPGGVTVYYSTWQSLQPDGRPIEGNGVKPDVEVVHPSTAKETLDEDPTFQAARAALHHRVSEEAEEKEGKSR